MAAIATNHRVGCGRPDIVVGRPLSTRCARPSADDGFMHMAMIDALEIVPVQDGVTA